jgi:signal transduction histidine kinase
VPDRGFTLPKPTPWYRWIGPWPFRPVVTFFLSWYFFVVTSTGILLGQNSVDPSEWIRGGIIYGAPAAGVLALVIWLGRRWQSAHGVRPLSYVVFIFLAAAAAMVVRSTLTVLVVDQFANVPALALGIFRFMLMIFMIMAVSGAVVVRLQEQVNATERALRQVRDQQTIMVEADEAARRQVAALLHDRVQAGLIAACLELQLIAQRQDAEDQQSLRKVIDRLEELRALDVRRAARALSPSLEEVDLKSALEELAAQYEPSIETYVRVTPLIEERRADLDSDLPIAIYRIVEQALLNAATHGQAQHVWVDIEATNRRIDLTVRDDGLGLADITSTGLGSAVIDTWTRALGGTWSLTPAHEGGTLLKAHLAFAHA